MTTFELELRTDRWTLACFLNKKKEQKALVNQRINLYDYQKNKLYIPNQFEAN